MLKIFTGTTLGGLGCGIERTKRSDSFRNHHRVGRAIEYDGLGGRSWFRNADSASRLSSLSLATACGKTRDQAAGVDALSQDASCGLFYLIQEILPFEFRKEFDEAVQRRYQRI